MTYKITKEEDLKPVIIVCGVGGAGSNAVNNMIKSGLEGAKFIVANTDAQALQHSLAPVKLQLGLNVTKGLGAGSIPTIGATAADESRDEIKKLLEGANMVFITAGMGGGTGTGSAPVIAKMARDMDILTVGVVTKPFDFEGPYRMHIALQGLEELKKHVDTLIIIPNQNLFRLANEHTTFLDAFRMSDEILNSGVRSITDLINMPGLINLDFADIKTIMFGMGTAVMGTGEASDEERAISAARAAVTNPLLAHSSIQGAKSVLVNITGGLDITLHEVDAAANHIREAVNNNEANIIFGSSFDASLNGAIKVSVIATGIETNEEKEEADLQEKKFKEKKLSQQPYMPFSNEMDTTKQTQHEKTLKKYGSFENIMNNNTASLKKNYLLNPGSNITKSKIKLNLFNGNKDNYQEEQVEGNYQENYELPTFLRNNKKIIDCINKPINKN